MKNQKMRKKRHIFQRLLVLGTSQALLWTLRQVPDNFAI